MIAIADGRISDDPIILDEAGDQLTVEAGDIVNVAGGADGFVTMNSRTATVRTIDVSGPAILGDATAILADQAHRGVQTDPEGTWTSVVPRGGRQGACA